MTGQRPLLGVAPIALMASCFGTMDSIVRWLGGTLPALLMLTVRYAFQALVMAAWLAVDLRRSFSSEHPRVQALRGLLLAATGAFTDATFQLLTSRLSALEGAYTTHFWTGFVGTAILVPLLLASPVDLGAAWAAMSPLQVGLLLVGALGTLPDAWGWVGMAIISVFGAASAWLNVRSAQAATRPISAVEADTVAD